MTNLNESQFHAYRGLLMGNGAAPKSDDEILSQIRPVTSRANPHLAYGNNWTTEREVSDNFASNPNAGGYETMPGHQRAISSRFHEQGSWGVVLDAHVDHLGHDKSAPYSKHEREVAVPTDSLQSVTAHVYESTPYRGRRAEGLMPKEHHARDRAPRRSFEVPPEHWQTFGDKVVQGGGGAQDQEFTQTPVGRRWVRKPLENK